MTVDITRLRGLVAELTLEEKVLLVSGASFWSTAPLPRIGLRSMILSDGPSGVRGPVWDERSPSLSMPSATALASSWDPALAYRYGAAAAAEARRKGVDVVLGPTINLHRSPLGGRHFEAFSEDPLLSGVLAVEYVKGLQDNGVAATPKHYVANDSETDRFTVDVRVDARVLRELYFLPFELAVGAGAWAIMVAYNSVDGVTMTENDLLETPLFSEWGFDGATISDWTAVRSLAAARAQMDLAMPGPDTVWNETLAQAIRDGDVPEALLDRKVLRLLTLADRVGALDGSTQVVPAELDGRAFAREASIAGTVLLRNSDELPWDPAVARTIAVIGQYARAPRIQGGGSATVIPERVVSPLEGIRALAPHADVRYSVGAIVQEGVQEFALDDVTDPVTSEPGLHVTFLDESGTVVFSEHRGATSFVWFDGDAPLAQSRTIVLETVFTPIVSDEIELGFASSKHGCVYVDDELVLDKRPFVEGDDVGAGLLSPPSATTTVTTHAGIPIAIRAEFSIHPDDPLASAVSVTLGLAPTAQDPAELIAEAVEVARAADVVIVVVGTNSDVESEGFDRTSLDLPGRQDDLVRAVAGANQHTVVVVSAGAPVLLPWRDEVAAILLGYFGGQEVGSAIADVVFGVAEPGGRLTTTWPAALLDVPVLDVVPSDGVLDYSEGLHIGYRAWLRGPHQPAFAFGSGLGYTTWELADARLDGSIAGDDVTVTVTATNTGTRAGKHVVQVYAERPESAIDRPVRWLAGSAVVRAEAGASVEVVIPLRSRSFSHWEGDLAGNWAFEPGTFTVRVGSSVIDLPLSLELTSVGEPA
jgi:beta-glucosidase